MSVKLSGSTRNTHQHENNGTDVHEPFHLILVEWILSRVRMHVEAALAIPGLIVPIKFQAVMHFYWGSIRATFALELELPT